MQPCSAVRSNSGERTLTFSKPAQSAAPRSRRRTHANLREIVEHWNLLSNNSELHVDCTTYTAPSGETVSTPGSGAKWTLVTVPQNSPPLEERSISIHITSSLLITPHILIHQITSFSFPASWQLSGLRNVYVVCFSVCP